MQQEHLKPTPTLLHGLVPPPMSMSATHACLPTYSRPLSDNEQSYFLQSRAAGANDMILEIEFKAPAVLVSIYRMTLAWAILRVQHPMLAARVEMDEGDYHSCRWVYTPPSSPHAARLEAEPCIQFQWWTEDHPVGSGSDCDRRLSASMQGCAVLLARSGDTQPVKEFRLVINFAHCHIDGLSGHMVAHAFLALLGGSSVVGQPPRSDAELEALLETEWARRWSAEALSIFGTREGSVIPVPAEARLPKLAGKWKVAAAKAENAAAQKRIIGGHTFPRKPAPAVKSVSRMMQYSVAETKTVLAHCRAHGVTFSNAVFALCNVAWIRIMRNRPGYNPALPVMIYSAVNMRPLFTTPETMWQPSALASPQAQLESFVFVAVSYFCAVLPGFLPPPGRMSEAAVMWHRARSARDQLRKYWRSPMLVQRAHCMTRERGERARRFAKEDDDALRAAPLAIQAKPQAPPRPAGADTPASGMSGATLPPAPSVALLGLSQTGNIDRYYDGRLYPSFDIAYVHCHTRKNPGGMLLFAHTFRGRLALQFSWDAAGLEAGVVEAFWDALNGCVREFMIDAPVGVRVDKKVKGKL